MVIDDIPVSIPINTSTNTSPAKSDVEQSNIVSSTASGLTQLQIYFGLYWDLQVHFLSLIVLLSRMFYYFSLGEDVKSEVAIPVPEPVPSRPKNAFNWGKTDVVEYIKSLGFPKEAAVFEEQVGAKVLTICTIVGNTMYQNLYYCSRYSHSLW